MVNSRRRRHQQQPVYLTGLGAYNSADRGFNYGSPIGGTAADANSGVMRKVPALRTARRSPASVVSDAGPGRERRPVPAGGLIPAARLPSFLVDLSRRFHAAVPRRHQGALGPVGWKGNSTAVTWDLSGTFAKNTLALSMDHSLNACYGPLSQTSFQFGTLSQKEMNVNPRPHLPGESRAVQPGHAGVGRRISEGDLRPDGRRPAILWRRALCRVPHPLYIQTSPAFTPHRRCPTSPRRIGLTFMSRRLAPAVTAAPAPYAGSWSE